MFILSNLKNFLKSRCFYIKKITERSLEKLIKKLKF